MTAAVLFALYAAAAAMLAPAMLRGTWAAHSPQLAMTLWLALPVSWVAAIVLAIQDTGSTSHRVMASCGERAAQGPRNIAGASIAAAAAYRTNSTAAVNAGSRGRLIRVVRSAAGTPPRARRLRLQTIPR